MSGNKNLPDISEWYTLERIEAEEILWEESGAYLEYSQRISEVCKLYGLTTVMEIGCGTGWVPSVLDSSLKYVVGIDANPHMVDKSKKKNPDKEFLQCDIRTIPDRFSVDLVCCFAVLKHFSLSDWPLRLRDILRFGRFGLFDQHVLMDGRTAMDIPGGGNEKFHSIWPTYSDVILSVKNAGHEIVRFDQRFRFDEGVGAPEVMIITRRCNGT